MASPTDTRAANCTVLLLILSASCSRFESPDAAYQHARSAFVAGGLSRASVLAAANAARYRSRPASLWFWKFRLLQAEALTGQNRTKEANALLADPVPPVPELSQMEVRRLIDQAALRSGAEAAGILARARAAVIDPELAIRIKLFEG